MTLDPTTVPPLDRADRAQVAQREVRSTRIPERAVPDLP